MSHILKNLLLALGAVLLFGGAYMFMTKNSEMIGNSSDNSEDITMRTNQILADTKIIEGYKLDVSIFDDARFKSLKDFHIEIPDVGTGRENPFAPLQ